MAIDKKLIHFKTWENFISENGVNGNYTTPSSGTEDEGTAIYGQVKGTSIVFIKDAGKIWTHGAIYDCSNHEDIRTLINDLSEQLGSLEDAHAAFEELVAGTYALKTEVTAALNEAKKYADSAHTAISTTDINALFA